MLTLIENYSVILTSPYGHDVEHEGHSIPTSSGLHGSILTFQRLPVARASAVLGYLGVGFWLPWGVVGRTMASWNLKGWFLMFGLILGAPSARKILDPWTYSS